MPKRIFYFMVFFFCVSNVTAGMIDRFMAACEKGSMQRCYQAGVVYWTGEGAEKDIEMARPLLEISCDGGFDDACVALRTLNEEEKVEGSVHKPKKDRYSGHIEGKLYGDIDQDGKRKQSPGEDLHRLTWETIISYWS